MKENPGQNRCLVFLRRRGKIAFVVAFVLSIYIVSSTSRSFKTNGSTKTRVLKKSEWNNALIQRRNEVDYKKAETHRVVVVGAATPSSTTNFRDDAVKVVGAHSHHFRKSPGTDHVLSSIGIGTYLGDKDTKTDILVVDAIVKSVNAGINVIDTASNYRKGKGEISVGMALKHLFAEDDLGVEYKVDGQMEKRRRKYQRSELFVSTKAGFVATSEMKSRALEKGASSADFGPEGRYCITPECIEASLDISLERMGLETVDLLYLHNFAEKLWNDLTKEQMYSSLKIAFEHLEIERQKGRIQFYGLATFSKSFRISPVEKGALDLNRVVGIAQEAAKCGAKHALSKKNGCDHGMRFVQLPVSPHSMPEMYTKKWQELPGGNNRELHTFSDAALELQVGIFSSKSLGTGNEKKSRCLNFDKIPGQINSVLRHPKTQVLHVTRSSPGIMCALVGQKDPEHVISNLKTVHLPPLDREEFYEVVANC
mmetsp:Transcript_10564/g.12049  ORF Transcript_10564/g.12049 Transcript_10564/m.12049 type:complete len:482 (-) Transcript_10564:91-1536(-)